MKKIKTLNISFGIAFAISLVISIIIVGMFYRRIEGTQINKEAFLLNIKPTEVLDINGEVMAKFYNDRRSLATFDETPKEIVDSIVSTEDREFFNHAGFSVRAMSRAAVSIVKADGEIVQGGSTLTQQLIKNTHLNSAKSYERKFWEVVYASVLEQNFTKEEIFEMYINDFEFLHRAFGIKDAMMTYFGHSFEDFRKLPREERIAKSAVLAGLLKNPRIYDPFSSPEASLKRRDVVIENMRNNKSITEEEYKKAISTPLMVLEKPKRVFEDEKINYQELVHYALYEAANKLDIRIEEVISGGYTIQTSFNTDVYEIMREEFKKDSNFPANASDGTKVQGSMVLVNPKNGELIAFTGGREEPNIEDFLGFNRAFMIKKQPGSTIKPVVAYGPALESGKFTPYSSLMDEKDHVFPGGYVVKNWDNGGRGTVTMKEALRQSWNIPAVYALQSVGLDYAKEYTKKLGLDLSKETTLGIALGGLQYGVSPLEMADSYQAFANGGVRTPAHAIRKIEDLNNNIVYKAVTEKNPVIKVQNATDMKDMLRNNVSNGVARGAQISGRQIAGKTGTVEHPLIKGKANSDIWFVGFDEQILASVWMGYDSISESRYLNVGSSFAGEFFSKVGKKILDYYDENGGLLAPEELEVTPQPDPDPPTITLNGDSTVELTEGEAYVELGATANDTLDGDLTNQIQITGNVDTMKPGTYTITYTVSDKALNQNSVTRTVIVKAKPVVVVNLQLNVEPYDNNKSFYLSWDSAEGNVSYQIYRNGDLIQEIESNAYLDSSITQGESYDYNVIALDKEKNIKIGETQVISRKIELPIENGSEPQDGETQTPTNGETELPMDDAEDI